MAGKKSVIETGVDKLVRLVNDSDQISVKQASKELGVSAASVEEWADFLEEEGIITIKTKFATVYLVKRQLTKKELTSKVCAFRDEKEEFIRRAESSLNALERDHEELKLIDSEFKKIRDLLEENFTKLSQKLEELQNFRKTHYKVELKQKELEKDYEDKIDDFESRLKKEQKQYEEVIKDMDGELGKVDEEKNHIDQMKESEKQLQAKVGEVNRMIAQLQKEIEKENEQLEIDEERLKKAETFAKKIKAEISSDSDALDDAFGKVKVSRKEIEDMEKAFMKDLERLGKGDLDKIGSFKQSKDLVEKMEKFFSQTKSVDDMIAKAEREESDLEEHFRTLLKKVKAFSVVASIPDVKKEMAILHKELVEIESKKGTLSSKLKQLRNIMRSFTK